MRGRAASTWAGAGENRCHGRRANGEDVWHKKVSAGLRAERHRRNDRSGVGGRIGVSRISHRLTNTLNVPRWPMASSAGCSVAIRRSASPTTPSRRSSPECDDGSPVERYSGRHVSEADAVMQALDDATSGPVAEGTVGAGTGMISYGFKGGIGTASRRPFCCHRRVYGRRTGHQRQSRSSP